MKKGVIILLVLLAVVVLVSPAIVGRLAERSMDENLNWAAAESGAVRVTSEHYTRGWFSSEGRHRIALREGEFLAALRGVTGPMAADDVPILIINTRLDHGLIPLTSMAREKGSLLPGLGSAVSTLQLELPDGRTVDLPGKIYSEIALGGELRSNYVVETGAHSDDSMNLAWSESNVSVTTNPASGEVEFAGDVGPLSANVDEEFVGLAGLRFQGRQHPTSFGVAVGDVSFTVVDVRAGGGADGLPAGSLGNMTVTASSELEGDDVNADASVSMMLDALPQFGDIKLDMAFRLTGADARALGNIQRALEGIGAAPDPIATYALVETDLKTLFADGFEFSFEDFKVTMPQGTVNSTMNFSFAGSDPAAFAWTSLLLDTEAAIEITLPATLVETYGQSNPQLAMAIGGGYLIRQGEAYEMKAELRKGLLTINGAPIPIPVGATR